MSTEGTTPTGTPEAPPAPAPAGVTVVGHDDSTDSDYALTTALRLADRLHAPAPVVRAWCIDTASRWANWEFGCVSSFAEYSDAVRAALIEDTASSGSPFPQVSIGYRAVHSGPARSLIEVSQEARMLLVGSRGRGGLAGPLLGSVSDQCARPAVCPVLVTRRRPGR